MLEFLRTFFSRNIVAITSNKTKNISMMVKASGDNFPMIRHMDYVWVEISRFLPLS